METTTLQKKTKVLRNKQTVTRSKFFSTKVASTFPFMKLSAVVAQQSCNFCRIRIFSIHATTVVQQFFDHATVNLF